MSLAGEIVQSIAEIHPIVATGHGMMPQKERLLLDVTY